MKVYFVRHGQTEFNKQRLIQGHADIPLNATGELQALQTANHFRSVQIDVIITSPLVRAKETARIIASTINYSGKIIVDHHFKERNFGEADGKSIPLYIERISKELIPGLEKTADLKTRVVEGLNKLADKYPDKTVLIVCHSQTIKAILSYIDPVNYNLDAALGNCAISLIEYKDRKWRIVKANFNDYID